MTRIRRVGTKRDQAETAALSPASNADSVLPSQHQGAARPDQRAWRCMQALVGLTLVQPALDPLQPPSLPPESCWTSNRSSLPHGLQSSRSIEHEGAAADHLEADRDVRT
jgi:hypothetical protein